MTATTLVSERHSLLDTSTGDLVLRISGSSRNGQIVRLKSAKCTIGSAPHCTLRLRADGVAPLHCLLLRGPTATIVRCWSTDTRLNHKFFTDAVLSCGDRLGIGPIELEVLGVGTTPLAREPEIEHEEIQRGDDEQREQLAARLAEFESRQSALMEERRQWQAQQETERGVDEQREQVKKKEPTISRYLKR